MASSALERLVKSAGEALGAPDQLSDYINGPKHLIEHPIDSAKLLGGAMANAQSGTAETGYNELKHGDLGQGISDVLYSGIPLIGPALSHAGHQFSSGDIAGGVGTTLGTAAPLLIGASPKTAAEALTEHHTVGGSTFDPRTGQNLAGRNAWAVTAAPERSRVSIEPPTPADYQNFVKTNSDVLSAHPNSAVGTWIDPDTGLHHLEISATTPSKAAAANLGQSLGENTIYHLGRGETAPTGFTGDRLPVEQPVADRFATANANIPPKQSFTGTHFSDAKLDTIQGARRGMVAPGSGIPFGAESSRIRLGSQTGIGEDAPPGFYVYKSGTLPDATMAGRKNAYTVRGQYAFGSTDSPEFQTGYNRGVQNALEQGADFPTAHALGLNAGENALRDAGYDGYSSPRHPGTHFIFGDASVSTLQPSVPKFAEWPEEYRNAAMKLDNSGGGGANYSAADLAALKQKYGFGETQKTPAYNYIPLDTSEPFSGTMYHGSKAALKDISEANPDTHGRVGAKYGLGLYLTDNPEVAEGYSRTKGKGATGKVYPAQINRANLLDMEKPASDAVRQKFNDLSPEGTPLAGNTTKELFDSLKDEMEQAGMTEGDALETYQNLASGMRDLGYHGFRHTGGTTAVGKYGPHNVAILFPDYGVGRPLSDIIAAPKEVVNNASGESAASQEAINRVASEKAAGKQRFAVDSRSGKMTPLLGVDAVDRTAGPYEHIIETGPDGSIVLDSGKLARPLK